MDETDIIIAARDTWCTDVFPEENRFEDNRRIRLLHPKIVGAGPPEKRDT